MNVMRAVLVLSLLLLFGCDWLFPDGDNGKEPEPEPEPTVELCGRWDARDVAGGRYRVINNVWGAETAQCIEVGLETGNFTITRADHDNGNNVAAYPAIYFGCHWGACTSNSGLPRRVQELSDVRTSWTLTPITTGRWNAAYDIWFSPVTNSGNGYSGGAELMIWLNWNGGVMPGGSRVATVELAGATWEVWYADWDWNYIAYRRTTPTTSVSELDLKAFIDDAVARGYIRPEWYLHAVETGFELWEGGAGLRSADFSVTVQ
ncbi:glycoside hydrolase family 12 [Rhodothermus marinus DSM 4252]|uniref:Glycoside hydrolase family 12 n=2 Tax=Rhodothermus marinus TaxID=29549 RepID=D0MJ55_RHOM4|nr:glycoside hydrolase family 12 [Rhodothermus marinus DSM 4252]